MASPALSTTAASLRPSIFAQLQVRLEAYQAAGGELIPLHLGDTYLPPPPSAVLAAAPERAGEHCPELSVYASPLGLSELKTEIVRHLAARGLSVPGEAGIHVGCGATHALFCATRSIINPGDDVLIASPYWPLIIGIVHGCGARDIQVPLSWPLYQDPDLDLSALFESYLTARTRALYLISPNNPDGQIYRPAQLEQIADFARQHDLWVIADEVYADYVYEGEHASIAALPGMAERTITAGSLSKSHGLAGARIGWVMAPAAVISATSRMSNHTLYNVPVTMQRVALTALRDRPWLEHARDVYRAAREVALQELFKLGVKLARPRGGSFVFIDLTEHLSGRSMVDLMERGIDHGVLLSPGEAFGRDFTSFVRICFTAAPADAVAEGIRRFGRVLESLS